MSSSRSLIVQNNNLDNTSHSFRVLSIDHNASCLLHEEKASAFTALEWHSKLSWDIPTWVSHKMMVISCVTNVNRLPLSEKATAYKNYRWTLIVWRAVLVAVFHSLIVLSSIDASSSLSEEKNTPLTDLVWATSVRAILKPVSQNLAVFWGSYSCCQPVWREIQQHWQFKIPMNWLERQPCRQAPPF